MPGQFDESQHPRGEHGRWTAGGGGKDEYTAVPLHQVGQMHEVGSRNKGDIANELNSRAQTDLAARGFEGGKITGPSEEANHLISDAVTHEVIHELTNSRENAGSWYTEKMDEAMKIAAVVHPEIKDNPNANFGYKAGLAITSQGETIPSNTRLAEQVYETYKTTGRFPTDIKADAGKQMNGGFGKLNELLGKLGVQGTQDFLNKEFTVRELNKLGYKITGENKDTKVYGSAILGPKIGNGYYQNINGNYKPLTADMWWMRTWGRLTGTLTGTVPLDKPLSRFRAALEKTGEKVPTDHKELLERVDRAISEHEKDYKTNREQYDSGEKKKTELALSAERVEAAVNGIRDMPTSGGQRQWMRDVVSQAQQKLADMGHPMTVADIQATLWYPEKRLYTNMGGRSSTRLTVDYSTALRNLAKSKGISEEQINDAVGKHNK